VWIMDPVYSVVQLIALEPTLVEPVHSQPIHTEVIYVEPTLIEPAHVHPVPMLTVHVKPITAEPIHTEWIHVETNTSGVNMTEVGIVRPVPMHLTMQRFHPCDRQLV